MAFATFNQTVIGTRPAGGAYIDGVWVEGSPQTLTITTSIQPAGENELQLLPEGRRVGGAFVLRSVYEILEGDVFDIYGNDHEILASQTWQNGVIPHYMGVAVRELST